MCFAAKIIINTQGHQQNTVVSIAVIRACSILTAVCGWHVLYQEMNITLKNHVLCCDTR